MQEQIIIAEEQAIYELCLFQSLNELIKGNYAPLVQLKNGSTKMILVD